MQREEQARPDTLFKEIKISMDFYNIDVLSSTYSKNPIKEGLFKYNKFKEQ